MSKTKNPYIKLTCEQAFKDKCEEYAIEKGFKTASDFSRFAMVSYMNKNPLREKARKESTKITVGDIEEETTKITYINSES